MSTESQGKLDALLAHVSSASNAWLFMRRKQLGLYYVAQHATDAGFVVRVDSLSSNDHVAPRLIRLLREHDCPVLGFYVDHDNMWEVRRIVAAVKSALPTVQVVLGGPQVTAAASHVLSHIPQALCGVIGEGEETFVELLRQLLTGILALSECRGIAFWDGEVVVKTAPRPPIADLDCLSIPRRRELTIENDEDYPASLLTGRGCFGRCAFCVEGHLAAGSGPRIRLHSIERCFQEIDYLIREFHPSYITIMDDTFVTQPPRLREFCTGIVQRYGDTVKWYCEARVDTLFRHQDLLPLMIEAGLIRLQVGGESGCQEVLDAYSKGTTVEELRWLGRETHRLGLLSCYVNFIIGGAFETMETYRMTRDLACELLELAPGCMGVGHSYFTPYPATPIFERPEQYGLEIIDQDAATGFGDAHVFCRTETLSRFDILALGPDFDAHVRHAMERLSESLPDATVDRIFEAAAKWKMQNEWYDVLCRDPLLFGYYESIYEGESLRFDEVRRNGIDTQVPMRLVELRSSKGNQYVIRAPRSQILLLDPLDSMAIELATGKLSFVEIVDTIADRLEGMPHQLVRQMLLDRFAHFDEERVVLWRNQI
jgi:anaerobic magnesium-protoporphyrin IX monomethyl ester cyclase